MQLRQYECSKAEYCIFSDVYGLKPAYCQRKVKLSKRLSLLWQSQTYTKLINAPMISWSSNFSRATFHLAYRITALIEKQEFCQLQSFRRQLAQSWLLPLYIDVQDCPSNQQSNELCCSSSKLTLAILFQVKEQCAETMA